MFDNLREQGNDTPFYEEEAKFQQSGGRSVSPPGKSSGGSLLGMTSAQRFIVAVMLLIAICALGSMCLLLTGRISLM